MKKRLLYLFSALFIFGATAGAETIQNYTYNFDDELNTADHYFHPSGWIHSVPSAYGLATYEWNADEGINGSGCLSGTQKASYYNDLLFTPVINGKGSLYVKLKEAGGSISFFSIGEKTGENTYSSTKLDYVVPTLSADEWVKVDIPSQNNARIGLRLDKVYIDNFSADACEIVLVKSFSISNINLPERKAYSDENGVYSLTYTAQITNTGEAVLTPGDEDYSLNHIYPVTYTRYESYGSTQLPEVLAPGESKTMTINASLTFPEEHTSSWTKALNVMDNISKDMEKSVKLGNGSITFFPYIPEISFFVTGTDEEYLSNRLNDFTPVMTMGVADTSLGKTKTFSIKNIAPKAPATIEEISIDGTDFTVDFNGPITLAAGESTNITISLANENPGVYVNKLTVKSTGLSDLSTNITAAVPESDKSHADFENSTVPAGYILSGNWEYTDVPDEYASEGHQKAISSKESASEMITSKMNVDEGDTLMIGGYADNDSCNVTVEYSADRSEWTEAYKSSEADATNRPSSDKGSDNYLQRSFIAVDAIPAGEWYIRITDKGFNIDDIYGFNAIATESGLVIKSADIPATATVNNPYTAHLQLSNAGTALSASDYTVTLYFDDRELYVAPSQQMDAGATLTFTLSAMIHEAGEYEAYIAVESNGKTLSTDTVTITVKEEATEGETVTVGPLSGTKRNNGGPISNVTKYQVEYLQTKARIEKYAPGMKAGAKIGALTFYGAYTGSTTMKSTVTAYLKNSAADHLATAKVVKKNSMEKEPEELTDFDYTEVRVYSEPETMTKVFEGEVNIVRPADDTLFTIEFDTPFVWEGDNLDILLLVNTENPDYWDPPTYYNESNASGSNCLYYSKDTDFPNLPDYTYNEVISNYGNIPTMGFETIVEKAVVTGRVTHSKTQEPLADVEVSLVSPENVKYKATTDANGEYTIHVLQPDKQYKVRAQKDLFNDYESDEYLDLSDMNATHHFSMQGMTTGIESVIRDNLRIVTTEGALIIRSEIETDVEVFDIAGRRIAILPAFKGEKKIELNSGIYIVNNRKVAVK